MNSSQRKLEISAEVLRAITDSARDAIIIIDDRGKIVFANDSTKQLFGYTAQELIGDTITRLIPAHLKSRHTRAFEVATRGGAGTTVGGTYEVMALHKSGRSVSVEISLSMWEDENRRFFSGIARDMSERKRVEKIRRQSQESLDTILNSMDAIVYIADMRTHKLLFLNNYSKQLFGDIVGKTCWNTLQQGQSGPCDFCTNSQLLNEDGTPTAGVVWEFQNTVNQRWYQCRDRAIRWFDGRLVRMEIATDITDQKHLENQLKDLVGNDPLVGLPNRNLLLDRLDQAIKLAHRRQDSLAVLFIDLDDFKPINDEYGHRVGDLCLLEFVRRLRGCLRESDTLARYGGDEFILLLQNEVDVASVESIVRKLINVVSIPMRLDGVDIRISASVGVAFYPAHGGSPDQLISQADYAMYRAKHQADGHYYISPLDSQS
jgi:diguanylate cyclase (GGDEF)-like protein/PAS domain S-box-containing protein